MRPALVPVLVTVKHLTRSIQAFDKLLAKLAAEHYPEVQRLQQIDGVGSVISVAFALSVEDPKAHPRRSRIAVTAAARRHCSLHAPSHSAPRRLHGTRPGSRRPGDRRANPPSDRLQPHRSSDPVDDPERLPSST
jgi:hypothetical protein